MHSATMKITPQTTHEKGMPGSVTIEDVNFKSTQNIDVRFDLNRKVLVTAISILSVSVDTLSGGATLQVDEVNAAGSVQNAMVTSGALSNSDDTGNVQRLTLVANYEIMTSGNMLRLAITAGATATTDNKSVLIQYIYVD